MRWKQFEKAAKRIVERVRVKGRLSILHACTPARKHAFTLTELLVAIAILSIMFTLLFIPMTQAFDNARRGRVMAELQNAADYALEIMVRELMQAVEVMPQERVHARQHIYTYPNINIQHDAQSPLNLLDHSDSDDDTLSRIDFIVRSVQDDRLSSRNWQQAYTVITYYLRRTDPSRPYQYLDIGGSGPNRCQIFRAQWQPDPNVPEPTPDNYQNPQFWNADDGWILEDFSVLQAPDPSAFINPVPRIKQLISHNAITPPDIDVADLRFTVERQPEINPKMRKPIAVVIEMTLRKPTPGARAKRDPQTGALIDEPDAPSLFIKRRFRVVLQNVK